MPHTETAVARSREAADTTHAIRRVLYQTRADRRSGAILQRVLRRRRCRRQPAIAFGARAVHRRTAQSATAPVCRLVNAESTLSPTTLDGPPHSKRRPSVFVVCL